MAGTTHIKVLLTEEELQVPAIDQILNMYNDWLSLSKESAGGRKTRAANRRADTIYEEIMAFKLPQIKPRATVPSPVTQATKPIQVAPSNNGTSKSSVDTSSDTSSLASTEPPRGRTLRPRSRTPSGARQPPSVPSTPTQQSIRSAMKKAPDSANSANVLSAALNQQHPSVSLTKIRQLLRSDSAQKKREEEKERCEQVRLQRKAKEERAEAQKRQLLEERAITAKQKREQRILHAAELRKARDRTRIEQKLKEEQAKKNQQPSNPVNPVLNDTKQSVDNQPQKNVRKESQKQKDKSSSKGPSIDPPALKKPEIKIVKEVAPVKQKQPAEPEQPIIKKPNKANETFQKLSKDPNNIDISICDETAEEQQRKHPQPIAEWAKATYLRDAVISQFSKQDKELMEEARSIFYGVKLPVALEDIFGPSHAVIKKYLSRTSSAVWSTPHRPVKRNDSEVFTPTDPKRQA